MVVETLTSWICVCKWNNNWSVYIQFSNCATNFFS